MCTALALRCRPCKTSNMPFRGLSVKQKSISVLQNGLAERVEKSRKQIKERKNRSKKIRGVKKNAGVQALLTQVYSWQPVYV